MAHSVLGLNRRQEPGSTVECEGLRFLTSFENTSRWDLRSLIQRTGDAHCPGCFLWDWPGGVQRGRFGADAIYANGRWELGSMG